MSEASLSKTRPTNTLVQKPQGWGDKRGFKRPCIWESLSWQHPQGCGPPWRQACVLYVFIKNGAVKLMCSKYCIASRTATHAKVPADKLISELRSSMAWQESILEAIKQVWAVQVVRIIQVTQVSLVINNYSPKWRWIAVDIYQAASAR